MTEWIAITDRLPELEVQVLVYDQWESMDGEIMEDMRVAYLSEYTTRQNSSCITSICEWAGCEFAFNITHWMPLPKPPQND